MPWQAAWIERAGQVTLRRLCDDVDTAIATGSLDPAAVPALPEGLQSRAPHKDSADTPPQLEERDRLSFWAPEDVARLFRAAHHQRGVHGGGPLRITGRAPAALRFDLPLESFASGDVKRVRATG